LIKLGQPKKKVHIDSMDKIESNIMINKIGEDKNKIID
jgi:hypothetical protein